VSRSPAETARSNSDAFSRRDVESMLALHRPDAVICDRRAVGFGEFRGHDAIRSYYDGLFDNISALDERFEIVSDSDGVVVADCHLRARLEGDSDEVMFDYALRVRVEDGLITSVDIFDDADAALAAS
jgi:ketosteroid isomerase-like protein